MGYKIIKPLRGGIVSKERINIKEKRIYFTKALATKLDLTSRKKCLLLYEDTDTGCLCMDFKDAPFPNSFKISVHRNKFNTISVCVYAEKLIKVLGIETGQYEITGQNGSIYKTNIKINRKDEKPS